MAYPDTKSTLIIFANTLGITHLRYQKRIIDEEQHAKEVSDLANLYAGVIEANIKLKLQELHFDKQKEEL